MEARFHLPGLRNNFPLNMILIDMLKRYPKYFREGIVIASCFGEFPASLWNGGRFNANDQCDGKYVASVIKALNAKGVAVRYTYTNPLLTKEDLDDAYCNFCLDQADTGKHLNGVLVVSPLLEDYIRRTHPDLRLNSSTCKGIVSIEGINEELARPYDLVVLDYNMNNQFEELEKIADKERCEVLVNACCVPGCKRRAEHYRQIAKNERIALNNRTLPPDKRKPLIPWECSYGDHAMPSVTRNYVTHISPDAIWEKYLPMGFRNFKIEGRSANLFSLVKTYSYYFAKPEYKEDVELILLTNLSANKILNISRPRPAQNAGI